MSSLRDKACIVGVGHTAYRRDGTESATDLGLQLEAAHAAIVDAGLSAGEIDGLICPINGGTAEDFIANLGLTNVRYAVTSHTGGAASVAGLATAAMAVWSGVARHVLIPAGWCGYSGPRARGMASSADMAIGKVVRDYYAPQGAVSAVHQYALVADRYVRKYDVPPEAMGAVAVAFRANAQLNSNAVMCGRELTMQEYLDAPPISTPFRLFDCSLETDGAAAVVVSAADRAADSPHRPVFVMSVAEGRPFPVDEFANRADPLEIGLAEAAPRAFADAGVTPSDIDLLEVYDSFTVNVLRQIESAGFCKPGEAADFVLDGCIAADGSLPTNLNGGLLSEAHVQGMNNLVEAVRQLRGGLPQRQVHNAELAVVTGMGGGWGSGALAILRR
ncbi:transporter [Mycolicibacterium aromaticivorans JS19b1 = JCM 16368]|uniref:Transporter n=1 Tax=Mycolicibacterium aromaticivorans JS19b1 = JCM 16368 TaxID=1440774 RepID=A0A064CBB9_9MYCO|nr:transporter [Mycolicibacterium aromaticivorans]KDE96971.1 transporter [Mycolicibacterium aromaticivorans JS19b1 = JCM 16368]